MVYIELFLPELIPEVFMSADASRVDGTPYVRYFLGKVASLAFVAALTRLHTWQRRNEHAFLDVACVDQQNEVNKARGIASLGAVLARTERLVILSDESYWQRLWTMFEVAAFYRRGSIGRIDVISLNSSLREAGTMLLFLGMLLGVPFFLKLFPWATPWASHGVSHGVSRRVSRGVTKGGLLRWVHRAMRRKDATGWPGPLAVLDGAVPDGAVPNGVRGSALSFLVFVLAPSTVLPAVLVALAQRMVDRSNQALDRLSRFSLVETRCKSASDREALLALIGEWYTDDVAGEEDPARLRELGHHVFESLVRHELAPLLQRARSTTRTSSLLNTFLVGFVPMAYDALASPLPFGHSMELALNRAALGLLLTTASEPGIHAAGSIGRLVEAAARRWLGPSKGRATKRRPSESSGRSEPSGRPRLAAAFGVTASVIVLVLTTGLAVLASEYLLEPGILFFPHRECAKHDGLDHATRTIWKWKLVLAINLGGALLVILRMSRPRG